MPRLSERLNMGGQPCPQVIGMNEKGFQRCIGVLKYLGVAHYPNLETNYICVHECDACKKRVYDLVDTEDGRTELIEQ